MVRIQECVWSGGLLLGKSDTQKVALNKANFYKLKELIPKVDKMKGTTDKIPLAGDGIYVGWSELSAGWFVNIRRWTEFNRATTVGVCLSQDEWSVLKQYLTFNDEEMNLIKAAYVELLYARVNSYCRENCEGCRIADPSQMNHDCLTATTQEMLNKYLVENCWKTPRHQVILQAAKSAVKNGYALQAPKEYCVVIETMHKEDVLKAVSEM